MAPVRQIVIVAAPNLADASRNALRQAGFPAQVVAESDLQEDMDAGLILFELGSDPVPSVPFNLGIPVLVLVAPGDEERLVRSLSLGASAHLVTDKGGGYLRVLPSLAGRLLDVESQRRQASEEVAFLSSYDPLTGLPNRRLFTQTLDRALARADRHDRGLAILLLDLDQFKLINDSHGHEGGDQLLRAATARMSKSIRAADLLCRLAGDEFAVLIEDVRSAADAEVVAAKLVEDMAVPLLLEGREVPVTMSIGVATFPASADDAESLLRCADSALYGAKESGRNNFCVYSPELKERMSSALTMERDLRLAVQRDEFQIRYQPQIDVDTGVLVAFEALLGWQHPKKGLISQRDYLRSLEETGLILKVGMRAFSTAITQLRQWEEEFDLFGLRMAVDLSARQIAEPGLDDAIGEVIHRTGADAESVEIEVAETLFLEESEDSVAVLDSLAQLGVRISIDDFGVGYSSLRYLKSLPIQSLKIASPFIRALPGDDKDAAIVRAIVGLARGLDLTVVGQGVSSEQQLEALQLHQCDAAQGGLISEPLTASQARSFLLKSAEDGLSPLIIS